MSSSQLWEINKEKFDKNWLHIENIAVKQKPSMSKEINRHAKLYEMHFMMVFGLF